MTNGIQLHDGDQIEFADQVFRFLEGEADAIDAAASALRRQLQLPVRG
ncbi:MAG: hypothetical protein WKG01_20700 [Kofleriaceae bacterium]